MPDSAKTLKLKIQNKQYYILLLILLSFNHKYWSPYITDFRDRIKTDEGSINSLPKEEEFKILKAE